MFNTNEGDNTEPAINVANYSYSIAIILTTTIFQLRIFIELFNFSVMQQSAAEKDRARTGKTSPHSNF